jgi:hypothetical protein
MALTKKQKSLGDALIDSMGNITTAIGAAGVTLQDFQQWLKISEFKEIYDTAIQIQKDQALAQFMMLIDSGDRAAVIEYQKMQRQSEGLGEDKRVKREVMRVLIESQETKSNCIKEYCQVFKCTKSAADDQFDNVVAEFGLETPHQRAKRKKSQKDNSLAERFEAGNLTEIEMYSSMLSKALYDSENAEYPSERSKARADVISINQRLDEINERIRREAESDNTNLVDKLDAALSGSTPKDVAKLKMDLLAGPLAIEVD